MCSCKQVALGSHNKIIIMMSEMVTCFVLFLLWGSTIRKTSQMWSSLWFYKKESCTTFTSSCKQYAALWFYICTWVLSEPLIPGSLKHVIWGFGLWIFLMDQMLLSISVCIPPVSLLHLFLLPSQAHLLTVSILLILMLYFLLALSLYLSLSSFASCICFILLSFLCLR
jgi:hypothetical protein